MLFSISKTHKMGGQKHKNIKKCVQHPKNKFPPEIYALFETTKAPILGYF
jgi:hypothetical protein